MQQSSGSSKQREGLTQADREALLLELIQCWRKLSVNARRRIVFLTWQNLAHRRVARRRYFTNN